MRKVFEIIVYFLLIFLLFISPVSATCNCSPTDKQRANGFLINSAITTIVCSICMGIVTAAGIITIINYGKEEE